jgi:hypothetical protein
MDCCHRECHQCTPANVAGSSRPAPRAGPVPQLAGPRFPLTLGAAIRRIRQSHLACFGRLAEVEVADSAPAAFPRPSGVSSLGPLTLVENSYFARGLLATAFFGSGSASCARLCFKVAIRSMSLGSAIARGVVAHAFVFASTNSRKRPDSGREKFAGSNASVRGSMIVSPIAIISASTCYSLGPLTRPRELRRLEMVGSTSSSGTHQSSFDRNRIAEEVENRAVGVNRRGQFLISSGVLWPA